MASVTEVDNDGEIQATPYVVGRVTAYKRAKAEMRQLEAQCKQLEAQIKEYMGFNGTLVDAHGVILATWREHEQARLDTKRFKAEHPDMYEDYEIRVRMRPLKVK